MIDGNSAKDYNFYVNVMTSMKYMKNHLTFKIKDNL